MLNHRLVVVASALFVWAAPVAAQLTADNFGALVDAAITGIKPRYVSEWTDAVAVDVRSSIASSSMADAAATFLTAAPRNYRDVTFDQALRCAPGSGLGRCDLGDLDFLVAIKEVRREPPGYSVELRLWGVSARFPRISPWWHEYEVILVLTDGGRWQVTRVIPGTTT